MNYIKKFLSDLEKLGISLILDDKVFKWIIEQMLSQSFLVANKSKIKNDFADLIENILSEKISKDNIDFKINEILNRYCKKETTYYTSLFIDEEHPRQTISEELRNVSSSTNFENKSE